MRLNKTQKYAINWMVSQKMEVKEIVKELKLQIGAVERYIDKNLEEQAKIQQKSEETQDVITSKDLMIRHTSNKNNNTVSIMTKEASEMNDEKKKKTSRASSREQRHIFKIVR